MLLMYFVWPLLIAAAAVIYRQFLADQPVLNWWFMFGMRFENKWFHAPIWGCVFCISGQLALWSYVVSWLAYGYFDRSLAISHFLSYLVPFFGSTDYSVLGCVIFICVTISYVHILSKLYNHYFS